MFNQTFDNVTIKIVKTAKRGECLQMSKPDGTYILADFCGGQINVPDGTNAYMFGNKLIMVNRWGNMTDYEKDTVENYELAVVIHPYKCVQYSIKVGRNWGDVTTTLHHVNSRFNDANAPVDEIIFIFADTQDSDYMTARRVKLPRNLQNLLRKCNENSIAFLNISDSMMDTFRMFGNSDPRQDEFDYLYDYCYEKTENYMKAARAPEPDDVPGGVYLYIDSDNELSDLCQNEE